MEEQKLGRQAKNNFSVAIYPFNISFLILFSYKRYIYIFKINILNLM